MLKPIENLLKIAAGQGWDAEILDRKREALLQQVLSPNKPTPDGVSVLGAYAHGDEAMRVAFYPHAGVGQPPAHYAVQSWSINQDQWITQKSYFIQQTNARHAAIEDAKNWYPVMAGQDVLAKWDKALDAQSDPSDIFTNRAEFAEFWYDVKDASWATRYEDQPAAWDYDLACAEALFMYNGRVSEAPGGWDPTDIEIALANMMSEWGEIPKPVFTGSLRDPLTDDFTSFVQYASPEEAFLNIRESGKNARLRATILMDSKTPQSYKLFLYNKRIHDDLPGEVIVESMQRFLDQAEMSYHAKVNNIIEITPAVLMTTHYEIESEINDADYEEKNTDDERNHRIEAWAYGTTTLKADTFNIQFNWQADADPSPYADLHYDIAPADNFEYKLDGVKLVSLDGSFLNQDQEKKTINNLVNSIDWKASIQQQLLPSKSEKRNDHDSNEFHI